MAIFCTNSIFVQKLCQEKICFNCKTKSFYSYFYTLKGMGINDGSIMTQQQALQLFEEKKVRTVWDDEEEKWYFSIVDVVSVLTDSDYQTARKYWKVLKGRIAKEGNELVTNCYQLKLQSSDGKYYKTDVADTKQLFRNIQFVECRFASLRGRHDRSNPEKCFSII